MVKACLPRLLLLLAWVCFVLAAAKADGDARRWARWVDNGGGRQPHRRREGDGDIMVNHVPGMRRAEPPTASADINKPIPLEDRVVLAVPTPPALFGRQILNPQDAINSVSRSAQQAIAQASQSAREAVQHAGEQVRQAQEKQRQAEEQARQANEAATRASVSANNAVVQAQASAREGILNAQQQARDSASKEIAANLAAVTSSASMQLASLQASASVSAAAAIASATQAANAAVQNAQQQAQQQVQAAREDANLRVSQAQGAAVSVTQAAVAVVGAIIGSSLLSILGFYVWTRYRRGKRKEALRREIGYPKQDTLMTTNALAGSNGYPLDLKGPPSPTRPDTARTTGSVGMGYAVSDFGDGAPNFSRTTTFVSTSGGPQVEGAQTLQREPSVSRKPVVPPSPKKQPAYSLFPPRSREGPPNTALPPTPASARDREQQQQQPPPAAGNPPPFAPTNEKLSKVDEKAELEEETDSWLRTQTVSPFGDLVDSPTGEQGAEWPLARSDSPPPPGR